MTGMARDVSEQNVFYTCVRKADDERCIAVRDQHGMWSVLHPGGEHGYLADDDFWLNYRSAAATIVGPVG